MSANWRERKKQELAQALFEAAIELFEREGYEQTTVLQIAEVVGVAKGTFFNHFPTKEHVVSQWYNQITLTAIGNARKRSSPSAAEAVASLFAEMSGTATASPELMIATARNNTNPLLLEATRLQIDAVNQYLLEQCAVGKSRGEIDPALDQRFFVGTLTALLSGTSRAWVLSPTRFDFPALIRQRVHFLFRAAAVGPT